MKAPRRLQDIHFGCRIVAAQRIEITGLSTDEADAFENGASWTIEHDGRRYLGAQVVEVHSDNFYDFDRDLTFTLVFSFERSEDAMPACAMEYIDEYGWLRLHWNPVHDPRSGMQP